MKIERLFIHKVKYRIQKFFAFVLYCTYVMLNRLGLRGDSELRRKISILFKAFPEYGLWFVPFGISQLLICPILLQYYLWTFAFLFVSFHWLVKYKCLTQKMQKKIE